MAEHVDVLIVGAGVSGVGIACHLQRAQPHRGYAILEAREALGGTWDLFRYPGIRSDSDLHTFGYAFKPWRDDRAIADGPSILAYVRETAREHGVDEHIRLGHRVTRASWSSEEARWTVEGERPATGERFTLTASFLFGATGYYRYDEGFTPPLPGIERFAGPVVHPQHWPADLDHAGRRVVVIGSGATAVTLVPAMAGEAEHVTMLQRSPTYVVPLPSEDGIANRLRRWIGERRAYAVTRRKNIWIQAAVYWLAQRFPGVVRRVIRRVNVRHLPEGYPVDVHFRPRYGPWDQRLCVVPDADLFAALSEGGASVVTDEIETFTPHGIRLRSGAELDADIVVTATGLNLLPFGDLALEVDGEEVDLPETFAYRGLMLAGVPNFMFAMGYTNASWTLKVDLVGEYLGRLLAHLDARGADACVPAAPPPGTERRPLLDFRAGYVLRAIDRFPRQGDRGPWKTARGYGEDARALRRAPLDDGTLRFFRRTRDAAPEPALAAR